VISSSGRSRPDHFNVNSSASTISGSQRANRRDLQTACLLPHPDTSYAPCTRRQSRPSPLPVWLVHCGKWTLSAPPSIGLAPVSGATFSPLRWPSTRRSASAAPSSVTCGVCPPGPRSLQRAAPPIASLPMDKRPFSASDRLVRRRRRQCVSDPCSAGNRYAKWVTRRTRGHHPYRGELPHPVRADGDGARAGDVC
jgi:hypothetical protein